MNTTQNMTFISNTKTLVAEASELEVNSISARSTMPGVLHNIFIKSHLTGKVVEFMYLKTHRNRDHDVTHWEYAPVDCPSINKLVVFND